MVTSILAVEAKHSPVVSILVDPRHLAVLCEELAAGGRDDLVALCVAGEAGRLVVHAADRSWSFGGL